MPNTTDAMKDTINTMFAEPINEVQVALSDAIYVAESLEEDVRPYLEKVWVKLIALKSKLPTPQG